MNSIQAGSEATYLPQLATLLNLNNLLLYEGSDSESGNYSGSTSWFVVSQKTNSDTKQILKEPFRDQRGDRS